VMFDLVREINRVRAEDEAGAAGLAAVLRGFGEGLGILVDDPEAYLRGGAGDAGLSDAAIEDLIRRRLEARSAKEWGEADRIRDELKAQGVVLEDGPDGTSWRRG
jgi:cysteinyl-tRNA synthetase